MDRQLRTQFIDSCNQQSDTKWPAHHSLLVMYTLTEPEGKITDGLGDALHFDLFVVSEIVVLSSDAGVVDHGACVCCET